jgi:hypothetical protein
MLHRVRVERFAVVIAAGLIAHGCAGPAERLNAPPQGDSLTRHREMQQFYVYKTDQAMMQDRSIADIHFIPHAAELSGLGQVRLSRYAELYAAHGGTIYYDTALADDQLIEARIAAAKAFLAKAAPGEPGIEVALGMPGGPGMESTEALRRREAMHSSTKVEASTTIGFSGGSSP